MNLIDTSIRLPVTAKDQEGCRVRCARPERASSAFDAEIQA